MLSHGTNTISNNGNEIELPIVFTIHVENKLEYCYGVRCSNTTICTCAHQLVQQYKLLCVNYTTKHNDMMFYVLKLNKW